MPLYLQRKLLRTSSGSERSHEDVSYLYHFTYVVNSSLLQPQDRRPSVSAPSNILTSLSRPPVPNYDILEFQYLSLLFSANTRRETINDMENRAYHEGHMRSALAMAEYAIASDETPVGCVFVRNGEIVARGINDTNKSMNGTRHAEFQALSKLLNEDPKFPLHETDLYVTVEPCIMCASALRQFRIRAVYFGCNNDKFGGTGGVLTINSDPGVDPAYKAYGGIFREEAIMLLRRFYVQENEKAPEPKMKKNRVLKFEIQPVIAKVEIPAT